LVCWLVRGQRAHHLSSDVAECFVREVLCP
jgi:hypothetical protein